MLSYKLVEDSRYRYEGYGVYYQLTARFFYKWDFYKGIYDMIKEIARQDGLKAAMFAVDENVCVEILADCDSDFTYCLPLMKVLETIREKGEVDCDETSMGTGT